MSLSAFCETLSLPRSLRSATLSRLPASLLPLPLDLVGMLRHPLMVLTALDSCLMSSAFPPSMTLSATLPMWSSMEPPPKGTPYLSARASTSARASPTCVSVGVSAKVRSTADGDT